MHFLFTSIFSRHNGPGSEIVLPFLLALIARVVHCVSVVIDFRFSLYWKNKSKKGKKSRQIIDDSYLFSFLMMVAQMASSRLRNAIIVLVQQDKKRESCLVISMSPFGKFLHFCISSRTTYICTLPFICHLYLNIFCLFCRQCDTVCMCYYCKYSSEMHGWMNE